jgi:hypothetical protein
VLSSRRCEGFLRPPRDHNKPDDQSQDEDISAGIAKVLVSESPRTEHPALHDVGKTRQPDQVAKGSPDSLAVKATALPSRIQARPNMKL